MDGSRFVSVIGAFVMIGLGYALSRNRKAVRLRVLAWGIGTQWLLAVLLLRVPQGQAVLAWVARGVQTVLDQAYTGSAFLFGEMGKVSGGESGLGVVFAFQVLPTIVFVAALFGGLYYLGVMQLIVGVLARLMVRTMGTSGAESLSVAASVFMGQTESPLTIRPYLAKLTESELFVVMVAGMASVSGAILGAYVTIGNASIEHLLTAVAMTAPISLMLAKIMIPETQEPETAGAVKVDTPKIDANLLDAVSRGTTDGLKLAVNVGAMLIAFIALISLCNVILGLIPTGGDPLTLERMLGWLFFPFALLMGTPWAEAETVGTILGTRTILNEIVSFGMLSDLTGQLSARSYAIATIAITGFANISSIGIQIGGLGALVPERKGDIARLGLRALVAATLANFSSACVAGALV